MKDNSSHTTVLDAPLQTPFSSQAPYPLLTYSATAHRPLAPTQHSYFRSKFLNNESGINPLTAAASTLLSFATYLQQYASEYPTHELFQQLIHEVKAFETSAQTQGYRAETTLIARYLLCATLDKAIHHSEKNHHIHPKLLFYFHNEENADERFFVILERLRLDSAAHVDLLELAYLCLNLGFSGKHLQTPEGKFILDKEIDLLYQHIRWQRGEIKKNLHWQEEEKTVVAPLTTREFPAWLLLSFSFVLLITVLAGLNLVLAIDMAPLYQQLNVITAI